MSQNHPRSDYFGPWRVKRSHQRLACNFGKQTLPHRLLGALLRPQEGGLAPAFKPRPRLRQAPPSGMVLLMVANVLRLSQFTHAGLARRDPTCHPPLRGLVPPQKEELPPSTKRSIKQRMVQNAFGFVHKSPHTTYLKITHRVIILAPAG